MGNYEWQINCPHCRGSFVRDENQIGASNLRATMQVLDGRPDAREMLENYMIHCPGCEALLPFEPRSRYRQRKALAVHRIIESLDAMPAADEESREITETARAMGAVMHQSLSSDFPLTSIREYRDKFLRLMSEEEAAGKAILKSHPAARAMREMMAIACADIGERNDLPEAPVDEVEKKRAALLEAMDNLHSEQPRKSPVPDPRGTTVPGRKDTGPAPVSRGKTRIRRRWFDTLFCAALGAGLLAWAAHLFHGAIFGAVVAGIFGLAFLFLAVLGPASGPCPLCSEMLHGLFAMNVGKFGRCPHCRRYFRHSGLGEVPADCIAETPAFSIPIGRGETLPSLCCVCAAPARRVKEITHSQGGVFLKIAVPYCAEHDHDGRTLLITNEDLAPSVPLLQGASNSDHRLVLKVRSYSFYREAVLR